MIMGLLTSKIKMIMLFLVCFCGDEIRLSIKHLTRGLILAPRKDLIMTAIFCSCLPALSSTQSQPRDPPTPQYSGQLLPVSTEPVVQDKSAFLQDVTALKVKWTYVEYSWIETLHYFSRFSTMEKQWYAGGKKSNLFYENTCASLKNNYFSSGIRNDWITWVWYE